MFTCGQPLTRQALAHGGKTGQIVGQQEIFNPPEPIGCQYPCQAHHVLHIQCHPAIQHQFDFIADFFARPCDHFFGLVQTIDTILRTVGHGQFDRTKAKLEVPFEVETGRIAKNLFLLRSAKQLVDRPLQQLPLQIPQRQINGADRKTGQSVTAVGGAHPPHHIKTLLRCQHRLAHQLSSEVIVDNSEDRTGVVGQPQSKRAVVGLDYTGDVFPSGPDPGSLAFGIGIGRHRTGRLQPLAHIGRLDLLFDAGKIDLKGLHIFDFHRWIPLSSFKIQ